MLVLNFFRFIILPLLKDAAPSQELRKQLKVAKDRVYAACDPTISWMKEDVTRTWLEVDTYVMVRCNTLLGVYQVLIDFKRILSPATTLRSPPSKNTRLRN